MASIMSSKNFKRLQSKKSHSWWWDSHISPKNSKWLADNLEEMDRSVRRMLKLIEEGGDSFAKKAEMYYQKRPELISLVEEFYRMYRSLAERYDHVTGELRKNIPSDLVSQGSTTPDRQLLSQVSGLSDNGSEPITSTFPSPVPENKLPPRRSAHRAAGFEFFLGSGGSSCDLQKEGDESSTLTDTDSESDDSSVNNYSGLLGNGADNGMSRKIMELEIELREMREKLLVQQEEGGDSSYKVMKNENYEDLLARIARYEKELKIANQRIQFSEEEVARLNSDLQKYKAQESANGLHPEPASPASENDKTREVELESETTQALELEENIDGLEAETEESRNKIKALVTELKITKGKLQEAGKEIAGLKYQLETDISPEKISNLQDQLALAHKDVNAWKTKFNSEKKEALKLKERIARLKSSLSDRDHEIQDLKLAVSDAEQKIFPEKAQIKAEISRLLEERTILDEQLREWESRNRALEDDIRMLQAEKSETEGRLNSEINQIKKELYERDSHIENLNKTLNSLNQEREELKEKVNALKADAASKDVKLDEMDKHLHQLHMEHVELIAGAEAARKLVDDLRSKTKDLEEEVERQRIEILEAAEEKREAIRQLCFSLEHYRNGYDRLRQAFGHKGVRVPVVAA